MLLCNSLRIINELLNFTIMKNFTLLLFIIIAYSQCFGQKKKGIITYKKEIVTFFTETPKGIALIKTNPKLFLESKRIDNEVSSIINTVRFKLTFNGNQSIFKPDNFLELKNNMYYPLAIGIYPGNFYYMNNKEHIIYWQKDSYGQKFLVKMPIPVWKLYNTTKKIGNYICYKATTIKKSKERKGILKMPVTVWYSPDIPISFGPLGYGGLPGLIVELTIDNERYYVDKINLNPKHKIVIKAPTNGKMVTKDQFDEIGLEAMNGFKSFLNN